MKTKQTRPATRPSRRRTGARRASAERLRALQDYSQEAIVLLNRGGTILAHPNLAVTRILGYTGTELAGRNAFELMHPEDTPLATDAFRRLLQHPGGRETLQFRYRRKDGAWRWLEASGANLLDVPAIRAIVVHYSDLLERSRTEEACETLVQRSPQGLVIVQEGRMVFANSAAASIFGATVEELTALDPEGVVRLVHPEDRAWVTERRQERLAGKAVPPCCQFRILRKNGQVRWLEIFASLIQFRQRPAVQTAFLDITERKLALDALAQSEARFRLLLENVDEVVYQVAFPEPDPWRGRVEFVSPRAEQITGCKPDAFLSNAGLWSSLLHPEDTAAVAEQTRHVFARGRGLTRKYRLRHQTTGEYRWMEDHVTPQLDPAGRVIGLFGVARDVTERQRAEAQLENQTRQLRRLSQRLLAVQETERRGLARELHDELGQQLTALNYSLRNASRCTGDQLQNALRDACGLVTGLMERVRELSLALRPAILDALGLHPALVWYADRFARQFRMEVDFQHSGLEAKRFAPDIETAAFRIAQEALTNVARHADVRAVSLAVEADDTTLRLTVRDHGAGFDPEQVLAAGATAGLSGMHERAALLGGALTVQSAPGQGTLVRAELPLPRPAAHASP